MILIVQFQKTPMCLDPDGLPRGIAFGQQIRTTLKQRYSEYTNIKKQKYIHAIKTFSRSKYSELT